MGSRTRIRWTGVAKLAAGAIGCAALALTLPALLERPKPPPLPADVGFAPDRGTVAQGGLRAASVRPDHLRPNENEIKPRPARHHAKDADRREPKDPKAHDLAKPTEPAPTPAAAPPAPTPPAAPTPSAPAVATVPPPAPTPTTVQAAAPAAPDEPPAPEPDDPSGPSEFGFER